MQFAEGLSDRQAADAVRGRIDWKYARSWTSRIRALTPSVLTEFRARLISGHAEEQLLTAMLTLFKERWLAQSPRQTTHGSTHVSAKICALSIDWKCVGETLRYALNCLAIVAPERRPTVCRSGWISLWESPGRRTTAFGRRRPSGLGQQVGQDGSALLSALFASSSPSWLGEVPAVESLTPRLAKPPSGSREGWAGAPLTTFRLRGCILAHRMIWMRTTARNAARVGWATKST